MLCMKASAFVVGLLLERGLPWSDEPSDTTAAGGEVTVNSKCDLIETNTIKSFQQV